MQNSPLLVVEDLSAREVLPLRQKVLRPHQSIEQSLFNLDLHARSFHLGIKDQKDCTIAVASFYPESQAGEIQNHIWRLRGMAVEESFRGRGMGRQLVHEGINRLINLEAELLWCNARVTAENFYRRLGFAREGDAFDIEGIGMHYVYAISIQPKVSDI